MLELIVAALDRLDMLTEDSHPGASPPNPLNPPNPLVWRVIANGIVYAAGDLCGAVISSILYALLENVGTARTFRIPMGDWSPAAYTIPLAIPRTAVVEWYVGNRKICHGTGTR